MIGSPNKSRSALVSKDINSRDGSPCKKSKISEYLPRKIVKKRTRSQSPIKISNRDNATVITKSSTVVKSSNTPSPLKVKPLLSEHSNSLKPPKSTPASVPLFQFYEESKSERKQVLFTHKLEMLAKETVDENDADIIKENLNPETFLNLTMRDTTRYPLKDLDIDEFKGYTEDVHTKELSQLTLQLKHKKTLPIDITPPRSRNLREFFTNSRSTGSNDYDYTYKPAFGSISFTTDDISVEKIVKKLDFKIYSNEEDGENDGDDVF
ncbi:Acm1p SCDLUD_000963 [Saccharomycodes ludwigii]|uniref:Acm1p n=1 Tax=Saccharomycodes ludwigii TaxID=36035 RepID=UPI001E8C64FA|nr:hypothetical protein SCDLUD_000963 [Saccharomycodes ludwigii]KAH3903337.1 hypothetical protein SCDLUD_000963 [Saccharomycodes ludwigii]